MSNKVISLYVPEDDLRNGYFVLSDVVTKLPKDVAIVDSRTSYSSAHTIYRLQSKEFPEIQSGVICPSAYFKYSANSGIEIAWPTKEYEDIMLRLHNTTIEESINKDADVMENEGGAYAASVAQMQQEFAKMLQAVPAHKSSGCQHEWYMYGRTAAVKHCKKCSMVKENIVDNS
jgi:hypothetical protein